jgi:ubiquinone/menaquinone biosynthesis C-methylase UbiE
MFSDPVKNIEQFALKLGSQVADFGSGSGHYSFAIARAVGDKGKVYAVDIQKDLLTKLKSEANHQGLFNVEIVWGDVEKEGGSKLRSDLLDALVISNLMFQVNQKEAVAKEAFRVLHKDGKLLAVDWSESVGGLGPHPESLVTKDAAVKIFESAGFVFEREIQTGDHHFGVLFHKP